ncbi:hypothetical protein TKK_0013850 [Trichogramma kaykai]
MHMNSPDVQASNVTMQENQANHTGTTTTSAPDTSTRQSGQMSDLSVAGSQANSTASFIELAQSFKALTDNMNSVISSFKEKLVGEVVAPSTPLLQFDVPPVMPQPHVLPAAPIRPNLQIDSIGVAEPSTSQAFPRSRISSISCPPFNLDTCSHVLKLIKVKQPSLYPPYSGPHYVEGRDDDRKHFDININGEIVKVSTDQLKPAYFLGDEEDGVGDDESLTDSQRRAAAASMVAAGNYVLEDNVCITPLNDQAATDSQQSQRASQVPSQRVSHVPSQRASQVPPQQVLQVDRRESQSGSRPDSRLGEPFFSAQDPQDGIGSANPEQQYLPVSQLSNRSSLDFDRVEEVAGSDTQAADEDIIPSSVPLPPSSSLADHSYPINPNERRRNKRKASSISNHLSSAKKARGDDEKISKDVEAYPLITDTPILSCLFKYLDNTTSFNLTCALDNHPTATILLFANHFDVSWPLYSASDTITFFESHFSQNKPRSFICNDPKVTLTNDQAARAFRAMRGNGCSRGDEDADASDVANTSNVPSASKSVSENASEDVSEDASESANSKPKLMYVSVIDLRSVEINDRTLDFIHANFKVKQLLLGDFTVSCEKTLSQLKVDRLDVVENHFVRGSFIRDAEIYYIKIHACKLLRFESLAEAVKFNPFVRVLSLHDISAIDFQVKMAQLVEAIFSGKNALTSVTFTFPKSQFFLEPFPGLLLVPKY